MLLTVPSPISGASILSPLTVVPAKLTASVKKLTSVRLTPDSPKLTVPPIPVPPMSGELGLKRISPTALRFRALALSTLILAPKVSILLRLNLASVVSVSATRSLRLVVNVVSASAPYLSLLK